MHDLETSIQVLQCEYDDPLSTPRQKKPASRTVGPRPGPWTHCPPLKNPFTLTRMADVTFLQGRTQVSAWTNCPTFLTDLAVQ
ncbi:hypothetical protein J6590_054455 [Homalodisca vitripennis]|nr:hypothetical protein J6590_054455 [Homalodisca vitripennis]